MTLISAQNLAKSYGALDVFRNLSLSIPRGARIALVGPNGVGKTTLLRLLAGLEEPNGGNIQRARNLRLGYLPQEATLQGNQTLWEECLSALADLLAMEAELRNMELALAKDHENETLLKRYGQWQEEFERRGGYTYETRIQQTLNGLGFEAQDFNRLLNQLSGGQRTRAALARLLLSDPDLLLLDEPTNHLDIHAVEWLEGYLNQWDGAVLLVSHDRYFMDRVVDHVWEMSPSGLELYRGNYSAYWHQRQERWEERRRLYEAEKARLEKELEYIKRNIAGQNVLQAKGKLRRLSREVQAMEALGIETVANKAWLKISQEVEISGHPFSVEELERRVRALPPPQSHPLHLHFHLKPAHRSGDLVLRTRKLAIGYPQEGKPLFHVPDLVLRRGECVAVMGPNGAGKTTFLKTILGQIPPYQGEVILGSSLRLGYFAQAHEDLNPQHTLMEEIEAVAPHLLPAEIRNYLARFLFTGDEVFKKVATLSGGERGRLALAKLSLTQANLLLLDEPTNHLDIPSQEILQGVLAEYEGTILLVSHDRYLIDALATQIWEIVADQSALVAFEGNYTQYRQAKEESASKKSSSPIPGAKRQERAIPSAEERRRRLRLNEVEERINHLEEELRTLARRLESPPSDIPEVQRLGRTYAAYQAELEALLVEWEQLHQELEPS